MALLPVLCGGGLALATAGRAAPACEVTSGADDGTTAVPGTLRYAVAHGEDSGTTIRICAGVVVGLRHPLALRSERLTIEGGEIGHAGGVTDPLTLIISEQRATLRGVRLTNVQLEVTAAGAKVDDSTIAMSGSDAGRPAALVTAPDAEFGVRKRNRITTTGDIGVELYQADHIVFVDNEVTVGSSGVDVFDSNSRGIEVNKNVLSHRLVIDSRSAVAKENVIGGGAARAADTKKPPAKAPASPDGILIARGPVENPVRLVDNIIRRGTVVVRRDRVTVRGGSITDSPQAGLAVGAGADNVVIEKLVVSHSAGPGVLVGPGSTARISRTTTSANGGPGIDLVPAGVSPNEQRKLANGNVDFPVAKTFDKKRGQVIGAACHGCVVEAFTADGDEGTAFKASAIASKRSGRFKIAVGSCAEAAGLTYTATRDKKVTSEFATPAKLDCPIQERTVFPRLKSNCANGSQKNYDGDARVVSNIEPGTTAIVQTWWFNDVCRSQTWTLIDAKAPAKEADLQFKPIFPPFTTWDLDSSRCTPGADPGCEGEFRLDLKLTNSEPDDR